MSHFTSDSHVEVNVPAGTQRPNINVNDKGNITQISTSPDSSATKGIHETFLAPTPWNRYHAWQSQLQEVERTQPEYDKWKSAFEARMQGKVGPKPTSQELADYQKRCEERDGLLYHINLFKEPYSKEFKVISLPKNLPEAQELLDQMKPWRQNMIRPKGYREGLALAAPGGVVDEEELDTDGLYVQQFMMAETQKALEEEGKIGGVSKAGGSKKKNKQGKGKSQVKLDDSSKEESKGEGDKVEGEGNDRVIPLEETLWYSPPHFPRLAKALTQVAFHLERRIGTERAIAALHTALTDEAMNAETAAQTLVAEGEYYRKQWEQVPNPAVNNSLLQKAANYFERAAALGYDTAIVKAGNAYHSLCNHTKARALLVEASDKGLSELTMHTALGFYYLEGVGGPADGKKAAAYLNKFNFGDCRIMLRQQHLLRSRLYTYGLDPIKPDIVVGFSGIREALLIDDSMDESINWFEYYTLARGYRYGLLAKTDPMKALKYYDMILNTYKSCKVLSNVAQPHLPRVLREAKQYKEMMKRGADSLLNDPLERTTRFKLFLASYHNNKTPQPALEYFLGQCYAIGDGVPLDKNLAKQHLIKTCQHPTLPYPEAASILAVIYASEHKFEEMMQCIPQADTGSDRVPSEQLCNLYYTAVSWCLQMMEDGNKSWESDVFKYSDKLILKKHPFGWYTKGRAYFLTLDTTIKKNIEKILTCYVNAEKLLLAPPKQGDMIHRSRIREVSLDITRRDDKELLGDIYYQMGLCYMKEFPSDEEKEGESKPLNSTKGAMYLEKSIELGNDMAYGILAPYYFRASYLMNSNNGPGDPVKAFGLYKKAVDKAAEEGAVPPYLACEYGSLLLTGRGGVSNPAQGLYLLEKGTQILLKSTPSEMKEDLLVFVGMLMHTYNSGRFGVPSDSKKGVMYMELCKRLGGERMVPPQYELMMRYKNKIKDMLQ